MSWKGITLTQGESSYDSTTSVQTKTGILPLVAGQPFHKMILKHRIILHDSCHHRSHATDVGLVLKAILLHRMRNWTISQILSYEVAQHRVEKETLFSITKIVEEVSQRSPQRSSTQQKRVVQLRNECV